MKKLFFLLAILNLLLIMDINAQNNNKGLTYKIFRANETSFYVASVLIQGEKDAVLIDAQFTRADAHRVVADILESRKNLTTIYISHSDPDYYFGLEVLKNAFPNVVVYATESVVEQIQQTYQKKLDFWGPKLGVNGTMNIVLPQVLKKNRIDLEGNALEIKGLEGESSDRTYVWVPSIKAIVGGVNIYDNLHLWIADAGTKEEREAWMNILNEMEALKPDIVIPAHALTNENVNSTKAITFSKNYLVAYEKEVAVASDSETLVAAMQKKYPNARLTIALQIGAKVAKGEMKW